MRIYQNIRLIRTKDVGFFHDLTPMLEEEIKKSSIRDGFLVVSVLHTTAAITLQEPDQAVHHDGRMVLENVAPQKLSYKHTYEGIINATAHQKQMLIGNSTIIPVKDGSLVLGSWQKPFLVELFRAMERKVFVTIIGE